MCWPLILLVPYQVGTRMGSICYYDGAFPRSRALGDHKELLYRYGWIYRQHCRWSILLVLLGLHRVILRDTLARLLDPLLLLRSRPLLVASHPRLVYRLGHSEALCVPSLVRSVQNGRHGWWQHSLYNGLRSFHSVRLQAHPIHLWKR